jgi:lysophospholipase L1-like esterase
MAALKSDNFGIGGNTTQTLLWQIDRDAVLNGLSPRMVVLLIGTNNLAQGQTPEQVAEGIAVTVGAIQAKQPQAQVLLLGILPRGSSPDDPMRGLVAQTNQLIAPLATLGHITYLDIGGAFLQGDGSISSLVMADYLHPTLLGYEEMTVALMPSLHQWLQSPAPLAPNSANALAGSNPVVPTPTPDVQTPAQSSDHSSIIMAVLPRLEAMPVLGPTLVTPSLQTEPPVLGETSISADATVVSHNASHEDVGYSGVIEASKMESADGGEVLGWADGVGP